MKVQQIHTAETLSLNFNDLIVIEQFLDEEECQALIDMAENHLVFKNMNINKVGMTFRDESIRTDMACSMANSALSDLWKATLMEAGAWPRGASSLHDYFRFSKYLSGHKCSPHVDGKFVESNGEESQMTFMIYLNDSCSGATGASGATRFFNVETMQYYDILPKRGMAVLFDQRIPHAGLTCEDVKYTIRTDVMFP